MTAVTREVKWSGLMNKIVGDGIEYFLLTDRMSEVSSATDSNIIVSLPCDRQNRKCTIFRVV